MSVDHILDLWFFEDVHKKSIFFLQIISSWMHKYFLTELRIEH